MNKVSIMILASLSLMACAGADGINIGPQADTGPREEDSSRAAAVPSDVPSQDDAGEKADTSVPTPVEAGTDSGEDAGDAGSDAMQETQDSGSDSGVDASDSGGDPPPPMCTVRGSCRMSTTQCTEYEDNGTALQAYKNNCMQNPSFTWSDGPCDRANWAGSCEVTLPGEHQCPKARHVYSKPVTEAQITSSCAMKGGVATFP